MGARLLAGTCLLGLVGVASEPACPSRARDTAPAEVKRAPAAAPSAVPTPARISTAPKPDAFVTTVRPVLQARCAPCHEAGGKMYEKLPFDKPQTIASHRAGVLKRFQGEDRTSDRAALEAWLKTQPEN